MGVFCTSLKVVFVGKYRFGGVIFSNYISAHTPPPPLAKVEVALGRRNHTAMVAVAGHFLRSIKQFYA